MYNSSSIFSLRVPFIIVVAFASSVYHDQTTQNVKSDLWSTLSALLEQHRQKVSKNCYCQGFILELKGPLVLFGILMPEPFSLGVKF